jgi:ABC-type transport system involved in multi-copper enzyme maturation permease subunit
MNASLRALLGGTRAEFMQLKRSRVLVALTVIQAVTFLFLVSLFGMTGARAPTAVIDYDQGVHARAFIEKLKVAHHSFDVRTMDEASAMDAIHHGALVAMIVIPKGFTEAISRGSTVPLRVVVDNINTDMTDDIQRALPSAIGAFGRSLGLPGIHVQPVETDVIDHDTDFIPYLVASALVLAAFSISGLLSALAVAREFESGTARLLAVSPVHPLLPLIGRVLASNVVAIGALALTVGVAIFGYGIVPLYPLAMAAGLLASILIFGCFGVALGAALKRALPVASLVSGPALALFLFSGAYEPIRFDGDPVWVLAHFFPAYYAVGVIEHAVHGLYVTPESVLVNWLALIGWALLSLFAAAFFVRREIPA